MQLDFSGLNKLAVSDFEDAAAAQIGSAAPGDKVAPDLQREADRRNQTIQTAADVYKRYQENIKLTELLQAEILLGIRDRESIYSLFLTAAKALSLTVSNREFYAQIVRELPDYYPDAADAVKTAPQI